MKRQLFALSALVVAAGSYAGCSDLDSPSVATTFAPATVQAGPEVVITHPERGSFVSPGPITVRGRVTPGTTGATIQTVDVEGQSVPLQPDGIFEAQLTLVAGLNTISATGWDTAGQSRSSVIGVLAGEWTPLSQPVSEAVAVRLNDPALDALSKILEDHARLLDLDDLVKDPIYDQQLIGFINARVDVLNPVVRDIHATIDGRANGLFVEVQFVDISLDVDAVATVGGGTMIQETASVTADQIKANARLLIDVAPDGSLSPRIEGVTAQVVNFQALFTGSTLMQTLGPLLQGLIQDELEDLLVAEVTGIEASLKVSLDELTRPTSVQALGTQFTYAVSGERVDYDDSGLALVLALDTPPASGLTPRAQAAPGSYHTPGGLPQLQTSSGVQLVLDDDTLNRVFHVAWAQGLLKIDLDTQGLSASGVSLGGLSVPPPASSTAGVASAGLTLADLTDMLPELYGSAPQTAPLSVKVDARLPPLLEVTGAPDLLRLSLGELSLEVLVDRGQGPETLFEVVLHAKVGASVTLVPGQGLKLSSAQNAEIVLDLVRAPIVEVDERKLQILLSAVLNPLVPRLINDVTAIPMPKEVGRLTFFDLRAAPGGPNLEHLTVTMDLIR